MRTKAYAALSATTALEPFEIERREPGALDVAIDVVFCGVCHSDIHQARGEWKNSQFPMVPGHEIIGRVARVGDKVTTVKETHEMLAFCAQHGIVSDIELIPIQQINTAFERMPRGDIRYRFVIDAVSFG